MGALQNRVLVKRAFVLADALKDGPFDTLANLQARCAIEAKRVEALCEEELDATIANKDKSRLARYNKYTWQFSPVKLERCRVWPGMEKRAWASGTVAHVAQLFPFHSTPDDRLYNMPKFAAFFKNALPIILVPDGFNTRIDDGSHRAVAMFLAGIWVVGAWVGT